MTEAKHTPGPWALGAETIVISSTVGGGCVADCVYREEGNANARLIAAAPDMLACLIAIRALITEAGLTGFNCHEGDWAERLFATQAASHAAVRKATGA